MGEFLGDHPIRTGLLIFGGFTAVGGLVMGARYNREHTEFDPIRIPDGGSMVSYPRHEIVQVRMPTDAVESFDCGGRDVPIPVLGDTIDNHKEIVSEDGGQTLVECDMVADVPILSSDGQRIG